MSTSEESGAGPRGRDLSAARKVTDGDQLDPNDVKLPVPSPTSGDADLAAPVPAAGADHGEGDGGDDPGLMHHLAHSHPQAHDMTLVAYVHRRDRSDLLGREDEPRHRSGSDIDAGH
jgi:hypothetical protein